MASSVSFEKRLSSQTIEPSAGQEPDPQQPPLASPGGFQNHAGVLDHLPNELLDLVGPRDVVEVLVGERDRSEDLVDGLVLGHRVGELGRVGIGCPDAGHRRPGRVRGDAVGLHRDVGVRWQGLAQGERFGRDREPSDAGHTCGNSSHTHEIARQCDYLWCCWRRIGHRLAR